MDGKMDYGTPPQAVGPGGGPDAAAQFYTSKYIRDRTMTVRSRHLFCFGRGPQIEDVGYKSSDARSSYSWDMSSINIKIFFLTVK